MYTLYAKWTYCAIHMQIFSFREIQLGQRCKQKFPLFLDKKGGSKDINREKPSRVSYMAHTG